MPVKAPKLREAIKTLKDGDKTYTFAGNVGRSFIEEDGPKVTIRGHWLPGDNFTNEGKEDTVLPDARIVDAVDATNEDPGYRSHTHKAGNEYWAAVYVRQPDEP